LVSKIEIVSFDRYKLDDITPAKTIGVDRRLTSLYTIRRLTLSALMRFIGFGRKDEVA
jgi:hypothetical protein